MKCTSKLLQDIVRQIPRDWDGMKSLAKVADVSPATLWHWKTGITTSPRINTLVKVADALGYEIGLAPRRARSTKLRLVKR